MSLFPCAAGKDEFEHGYRCGTSEEAVHLAEREAAVQGVEGRGRGDERRGAEDGADVSTDTFAGY